MSPNRLSFRSWPVETLLTPYRAEREVVQRQIEGMDRQIDALVYELYGLTAEEVVGVVEGR